MISGPRWAGFLGVLAVGLALAGGARAADSPAAQADALISEGFKLRLQGKNAEALDLFVKAHALAPSGKTLGQMGSVEAALRRWVEAEAHIDEALSRHDSPWIEAPKNREMLTKTLADARQQIARIQLRGTPGAQVYIDGRLAGTLPLLQPVHVAAGSLKIAADANGFQPIEKEVAAKGGTEAVVNLQLVRTAPPTPSTPAASLVQPLPPEGRRPGWRTWTGTGLIAAGLGAVGVGIAWLVVDGRTMCDAPPGGVCHYLYDTKAQGWLAVGLGAAAVGAGGILLLWPSKHSAVAVTARPGSVALTGHF